jgi:hypothetical protein
MSIFHNLDSIATVSGVSLLKSTIQGGAVLNSSVTFTTAQVVIPSVTDYVFSAFVGVFPAETSKITSVVAQLLFYSHGTLVYTAEMPYDFSFVKNTVTALEVHALPGSIPVSDTVQGALVFTGIDPSDHVVTNILLPQITQLPVATSQIASNAVRLGDVYSIQSDSNLTLTEGSIEIAFQTCADIFSNTLFDTRINGINGFSCERLTDGTLKFTINANGTDYILASTQQGIPSEGVMTVRVEWSISLRSIYLNGSLLTTSVTSFITPKSTGPITIGCNSSGTGQINGKLQTLTVRG